VSPGPQVFFTAALVLWRDDFISDGASSYDDIHGGLGGGPMPSDGAVPPYSQPVPGSYNNAGGSTADL
jgi:hypothetical protein